MAEITDEFIMFLEKNYRSLYARVTAPNADKVTVDTIVSNMSDEFEIWKRIPQWIKNKYGDRIPKDVLNGVVPVKDYIVSEKQKEVDKGKKTSSDSNGTDLLDYSLAYIALGYSPKAAEGLANNKFKRNQMRNVMALGMAMTDEMRRDWHDTRQSDIDIMRKDWIENQPEKYLLHVVKECSRTEGKCENAATDQEKAKYAMRLSQLRTEMRMIAERFSDMSQRRRLAGFLQQQNSQLAMSRLRPGALSLFSDVLLEKGVMITRVGEEKELTRSNVCNSFLEDFSRKENFVSIMRKRDEFNREFLSKCAGHYVNRGAFSSLISNRNLYSNDKN